MKAIMYHYVRPVPDTLPYFRYLHVEGFRRQLDWFAARWPFPTREAFFEAVAEGRSRPGIVLTFDDGFSDHFDHVFTELDRRGLWGLFYIPTGILDRRKLLDVHRIQLLLGRFGGTRAMALLSALLTDEMLSHAHVEEFHSKTYARQDNSAATDRFKRTLNYFVSYDHREAILDRLMEAFLDGESEANLADRFYVTPEQLRLMHDRGMEIGSHGESHYVMSKLTAADQAREISRSWERLEAALDAPVRTFCYPYGGFHTFTDETERLLRERGAVCSFNVEQRPIADDDLRNRPQALPRYDCNQFPFGRAHFGAAPPEASAEEAEDRPPRSARAG